MNTYSISFRVICFSIYLLLLLSCNNKGNNPTNTMADSPVELQQKATNLIKDLLEKTEAGQSGLADSSNKFGQVRIAKFLYEKKEFSPYWSFEEKWLPQGDSLFKLIEQARLYGLFPDDYHLNQLREIRELFTADTLAKGERKDALLWSKADIMLTDAFVQIIKDVKLGRLPQDSITLRKDSVLSDEFYAEKLLAVFESTSLVKMVESLEPSHKGYQQLKKGLPAFLAKAENKQYTFVPSKEAPGFARALQKRLFEAGYIAFDSVRADSIQLADAVKKYQKEKGIAVDGRAGEGTVRMLNTSDVEKFIRIAISMDKYKMLPEVMPSRYIWVNASANYLEVIEGGDVKLTSKVICGKAKTRTPVLSSAITSLITYPQWVPPPSIVLKEILPALKRNPGYLARKGFSLETWGGKKLDPYSINWAKYSKSIPYKIVQGSSDGNALGIMKFVFDNKYSVYLHDTNQRYLFANAMRSLSHGCVRVQEWEKLAWYILQTDSINAKGGSYTPTDSVKIWLANKQKKNIVVKNKLPVYIRYITCEGKNDGIVFYDDVYTEDKWLREKFFATK